MTLSLINLDPVTSDNSESAKHIGDVDDDDIEELQAIPK